MKERITITIASELLDKVDNEVNGTTIKNRSHAIELFLAKSLSRRSVSTAIILAGGDYEIEVERESIPTPMLEISGKPVLAHLVAMLKRQGIKQIIMTVSHKKEAIKEYFKDGSNFGLNISYVDEDQPLGTAGALKAAASELSSTFVVCNADELKTVDIPQMLEFHRNQANMATIALTTVSDASNYGVVLMNGNKVYQFIEKPTGKIPSNLINAGLYLFEPEALAEIPEGFGVLESDLFPKLAKREELSGYVFFGNWLDIRSKEGYEKAKKRH